MRALVDVECPECGHASRIEYRRFGSRTTCAGCNRDSIPRVPNGGMYPVTEWELSFADFRRLVEDDACRTASEPLLRDRFGYRISGRDSSAKILDGGGETVEPLTVHLRIQDDDPKQPALYRAAMTLWR